MDNVTAEMLDRMEVGEIASLPPGVLNDLSWLLANEANTLEKRKAALHGAFEARYASRAAEARLAAGKDTGAVHITDGEYDVCANAPKKVEWDQGKLKEILDLLSPENARHFAKVVVAVEEKKFEAAPPDIKKLLGKARTVKTGKSTYALSPLKEKAA